MSILLACIPDNNNQSSSNNTSLFIFILSLIGCIFVILDNNNSNNNTNNNNNITNHYIIGLLFITIPFRAWCNLAISGSGSGIGMDSSSSSQSQSDESSQSSQSSFASTISVLLVVWNTDTGALIVGRLLGRRRKNNLNTNNTNNSNVPEWIKRISPAKTMEGFFGGILGGIITSILLIPFLFNSLSIIDCNTDESSNDFCILWGLKQVQVDNTYDYGSIILNRRFFIGLFLSLFAILGDLVESAIKRKSNTKDSGSILPGHGGILDRFDSSLLAILFYRYILCVYFIGTATSSTIITTGSATSGNDENEL